MEIPQEWSSFICYMDEKPTSIRLNLALKNALPLNNHQQLIWFSITFLQPDAHGFSAPEENETIYNIEDDLSALLAQEGYLLAGTIKTNGTLGLYFYGDSNEKAAAQCHQFMQDYPQYTFGVRMKTDANWNEYLNLLYPTPYEYQTILNNRVLLSLGENGNNSTMERPIDHQLDFKSEEGLLEFISNAKALGYEVKNTEKRKEDSDFPFMLDLNRVDTTVPQHIHKIVWELVELATKNDGVYAGWGCPIAN